MHAHVPTSTRAVRVQVVTVSTSRTAATDLSGPLLKDLLQQAGHTVAGHSLVTDNPEAIGELLDKLLADVGVEAIVLTGGTGISARDCTPQVVGARLDRVLPGFGELFRMLSYQQVGAAAMLSTAVGGIAKGRPVFALPGSQKACSLAMENLILPELQHLVDELAKETPLAVSSKSQDKAPAKVPEKPAEKQEEPVPTGVSVRALEDSGERKAEPEIASGWLAGLRGIGGRLELRQYGEIPSLFEKMAAVVDVLNAAGERGKVILGDGTEYLAFGYPDLVRNGSKVLLVRDSDPQPEVVALHRWPRKVGICGGEVGVLPSSETAPEAVAEERTGQPYTGNGTLLAVEGSSIYLSDGRKSAQWDGRKLSAWDPLSRVFGSLILSWSQR